MAGMLPGVECARRRRMWQGGGAGADQAAAGTRRLSFCLYAAGHGAAHAVGTGNSGNKQRSCATELAHGWALNSNAREAKERLDQKLKSKSNGPDTVIKRHHSTGSIKVSRANGSGGGGGSSAAVATGVQREVYSKKGVMRRLMRWRRLMRRSARCAWTSSPRATCWRTCRAATASTGAARCPGSRAPPRTPARSAAPRSKPARTPPPSDTPPAGPLVRHPGRERAPASHDAMTGRPPRA